MDKKRLDRIVREEVASLLEAMRSRTPGTTGYRDFVGGRDRDDIEGIDKTTGMSKPWSTRGDYPRGGEDEPDDRTPEERRQDRERMRAARDAESRARSAEYQASQPKQKHVMTRGEGPARRVKVNQGSINLPPMARYDFLMNPANSEGYALRDEVFQPGMSAAGYLSGYATVDYNAADGMWTVVGQLKDAAKSYGGPTLGAGRTTVGTGADVESAYRDMLSKSDIAYLLDGASSLSESRWAQIAGLMTEGKRDVKDSIYVDDARKVPAFFAVKAGGKREKISAKTAKKMLDAGADAETAEGGRTEDVMQYFADLEMDEGSGAAPGATRKLPPVDTKKGPPGKDDLDKIKNAGPFEAKKR